MARGGVVDGSIYTPSHLCIRGHKAEYAFRLNDDADQNPHRPIVLTVEVATNLLETNLHYYQALKEESLFFESGEHDIVLIILQ